MEWMDRSLWTVRGQKDSKSLLDLSGILGILAKEWKEGWCEWMNRKLLLWFFECRMVFRWLNPKDDELVDLAFNKKRADDRKVPPPQKMGFCMFFINDWRRKCNKIKSAESSRVMIKRYKQMGFTIHLQVYKESASILVIPCFYICIWKSWKFACSVKTRRNGSTATKMATFQAQSFSILGVLESSP